MSRIFMTGDIHGEYDIRKLSDELFPVKDLTKNDCVIICGDFGLLWKNKPTAKEKKWLKWLEDKPWTTLFVDGNHENHRRLLSLPVEVWNGGKIHRINDSVFHLMRGQVFEIDGKKIFTMGGARSDDQEWRDENISWWKEEIPSQEERAEALKNLAANNWQVDYVITHCAPSDVVESVGDFRLWHPVEEFSQWLQSEVFDQLLDFKAWCFGHYHSECILKDTDGEVFIVNVFNKIFDPEKGDFA